MPNLSEAVCDASAVSEVGGRGQSPTAVVNPPGISPTKISCPLSTAENGSDIDTKKKCQYLKIEIKLICQSWASETFLPQVAVWIQPLGTFLHRQSKYADPRVTGLVRTNLPVTRKGMRPSLGTHQRVSPSNETATLSSNQSRFSELSGRGKL